jgi:hypothetical protein
MILDILITIERTILCAYIGYEDNNEDSDSDSIFSGDLNCVI